MSLEGNRRSSFAQRYKIWASNPVAPIPIRTLTRIKQNLKACDCQSTHRHINEPDTNYNRINNNLIDNYNYEENITLDYSNCPSDNNSINNANDNDTNTVENDEFENLPFNINEPDTNYNRINNNLIDNYNYEENITLDYSNCRSDNNSINNGNDNDTNTVENDEFENLPFNVEVRSGPEINHNKKNKTKIDDVIDIMELYIQHKLTKKALAKLLKILQSILPTANNIPPTLFTLFKLIDDAVPPVIVIKHFYCNQCIFYLGTANISDTCPSCSNRKDTSAFYEFDIVNQVQFLFEYAHLAEKLQICDHENNFIRDITDGTEYRRISSQIGKTKYDLTLILNTDGISLVKSAKTHCWPIMYTIAELPPHLRETFVIVIGLWCDRKNKPIMNTYLQPFCKSFTKAFYDGISWTNPVTKEICMSRVIVPLVIADAPARADILNSLSHTGKFGCNICEIKTKRCKKIIGQKRLRVYAFTNKIIKLRTKERIFFQIRKAIRNKFIHVKGMKRKPVISSLPFLDIGTCVLPEFMHSVLLGVVNQFLTIWFKKKGPWNIKEHTDEINKLLETIKPPDFFHRLPREISVRHLWKASEFYNFLLYYSIPILKKFLGDNYFQHWLLLVTSIYTLLQKPIRVYPDLQIVSIQLKLFVRDIRKLYGNQEYTYNVHQLLHLVLSVKRWGPLWSTSAFPFENQNGRLANCIHGTKHLGEELKNNLIIFQNVHALKLQQLQQMPVNESNCEILGIRKKITVKNLAECTLLTQQGLDINNLYVFTKARVHNSVFTSLLYKKIKTNSYTVEVNINGLITYGCICYFLKVNDQISFVMKVFTIKNSKMFVNNKSKTTVKHILPIKHTKLFMYFTINNIIEINHVIRVHKYICKRPNYMKTIM